MKLLIDANIVMDVLQEREPHYADSLAVWELCEQKIAEGFVSVLTFANIVYILRKTIDADGIAQLRELLKKVLTFAPLTDADVEAAANLRWKDFEDALQAATAEHIGADYIVTRNIKDFATSSVPSLTPAELLQFLGKLMQQQPDGDFHA